MWLGVVREVTREVVSGVVMCVITEEVGEVVSGG